MQMNGFVLNQLIPDIKTDLKSLISSLLLSDSRIKSFLNLKMNLIPALEAGVFRFF